MNTKRLIWIGMLVGSTAGGFLPNLWGTSALSMAGFLCSSAGGLVGIWLAYRLVNSI